MIQNMDNTLTPLMNCRLCLWLRLGCEDMSNSLSRFCLTEKHSISRTNGLCMTLDSPITTKSSAVPNTEQTTNVVITKTATVCPKSKMTGPSFFVEQFSTSTFRWKGLKTGRTGSLAQDRTLQHA